MMDVMVTDGDILPSLPRRFLPPADLRWGRWQTADGASLRWAHLPAPSPRFSCIMVGGLAECAEKYLETMADLQARQADVWFLDWRGQGGSSRPSRFPTRPTARDYARDAGDLAGFIQAKLPSQSPRLLMAHSMGAAIALLALAQGRVTCDAAVLSAPMVSINTGTIPQGAAKAMAAIGTWVGAGSAFAPGFGPWRYDPQIAVHSVTSHDPLRAGIEQAWFQARPDLRVDGPTYGWVHAAFGVVARLADPALLSAVRMPVLIGCPGEDTFVLPAATRRAAGLLPDCTLVEFPGSRHELFCETDIIRGAWFAAIDDFIATRLGVAGR